jgi:hypothetical protein
MCGHYILKAPSSELLRLYKLTNSVNLQLRTWKAADTAANECPRLARLRRTSLLVACPVLG